MKKLLTFSIVILFVFISISAFNIYKINTQDSVTGYNINDFNIQGNDSSNESESTIPLSKTKEPVPAKKNYNPLIKKIRSFLNDKEGLYGIHFISLYNNQRFGINDSEPITAASTTKVPINLYLYNLEALGKIDFETLIEYTEEDYEEGTGSIQNEEFGIEYTIRELSRLSIEESDNVAINMLIRNLGMDNVKIFMEGIVKHKVDLEHNSLTPRDMATFMKAVYEFNKNHEEEGKELLNFLENTEFNDRIPLYLPEGTVVAHKIGNQVGTMNDIGIIFTENPYIVAFMSKEVNEDEASEVIAQISKMIYDFEQN